MSSDYMRQIIESINRAQQLNEGYEERVQAIADALSKEFPEGVTNKELLDKARIVNKKYDIGVTELRGNAVAGLNQKVGDSLKDFMKDLKAVFKTKRDTSKTDAKRERINQVLDRLAMVIYDAVGMSFPDGDPFDHIYPKARKMGIPPDDVLTWLDRAIRKDGSGKSYRDYLATVWDDQYGGAKSDYDHNRDPESKYHQTAKDRYNMMGGDDYRNPWR